MDSKDIKIRQLQDALSEVLYFIPDEHNTKSPGVVAWYVKHREVIKEAAEIFDRYHLLV